jgi:hypothetical protein
MRFDHVSDAQGVDIILKTTGESTRGLFAADFGEGVSVRMSELWTKNRGSRLRVLGVNIVFLSKGEFVVVGVALSEANTICGL